MHIHNSNVICLRHFIGMCAVYDPIIDDVDDYYQNIELWY